MTGPRRRRAVNQFDILVREGLNHRPPIQIVSIYVGDIAAFYFEVVVVHPHLFVVCLGVAFGTYEC